MAFLHRGVSAVPPPLYSVPPLKKSKSLDTIFTDQTSVSFANLQSALLVHKIQSLPSRFQGAHELSTLFWCSGALEYYPTPFFQRKSAVLGCKDKIQNHGIGWDSQF